MPYHLVCDRVVGAGGPAAAVPGEKDRNLGERRPGHYREATSVQGIFDVGAGQHGEAEPGCGAGSGGFDAAEPGESWLRTGNGQ